MKNTVEKITRGEINFWIPLIVFAVSFAVAFTSLRTKVEAMQEKGEKLRADYESTAVLLLEVRDSQLKMEKDIEFIKLKVNGW